VFFAEMNRYGKDLLQILLRESIQSSFGKYISSNIQAIDFSAMPVKLTYTYRVPEALCYKTESSSLSNQVEKSGKAVSQLRFATSGILAVLDELSTYPIVLEDRKYRAGVSVDLITEVFSSPLGGEEVYIVTRTDKIGKVLGFCTMEMLNKQGELLARGKHVKYLPLGAHLDIVAMSPLFPVAIALYNRFRAKTFQTPIDTIFNLSKIAKPLDSDILEGEYIYKRLKLVRNRDLEERRYFLEKQPDNHPFEKNDFELFNYKVEKHMMNFLGALHGGGLATVVEEAARAYLETKHNSKGLRNVLKLKSLDIRWLSAFKVCFFSFLLTVIFDFL
jgi:acyl-coenzyme A thioesterase PaaI-like protein